MNTEEKYLLFSALLTMLNNSRVAIAYLEEDEPQRRRLLQNTSSIKSKVTDQINKYREEIEQRDRSK